MLQDTCIQRADETSADRIETRDRRQADINHKEKRTVVLAPVELHRVLHIPAESAPTFSLAPGRGWCPDDMRRKAIASCPNS